MILLDYATVLTPAGPLENAAVLIDEGGRIAYVGPMDALPFPLPSQRLRLDLRGRWAVPGFLDIHVHGGYGITFGETGDPGDELRQYSARVVRTGVTGFLVSLAAPDAAALRLQVAGFARACEEAALPGAAVLGLHLEGPFLNPARRGAFHPSWIRPPSMDEMEALLDAGRGWIRQVTLAPELPGSPALAARLRQAGVVAAMGHTEADYETAQAALCGAFTHVTHTFNAQRGFQSRDPGALGAVLTSDGVTAELIADAIHVHPGAMRVLVRCLGTDRGVLITDAMAGAGLADGEYSLLGQSVTVRDGRAVLPDGTLAGSVATIDRCVATMVQAVGVSLPEAVRMATLNPARAMGWAGRWGSVLVGREADLTFIDDGVRVYGTLVKGKIVYNGL